MNARVGDIQAKSLHGMERSFAQDVTKLGLGEGELFHGEGIVAITKALLQSGVSYIGGYPGAPISHLTDIFAEARESILQPMGIHLEQSASEAGAAALLGASIQYPLRGAVTWKSIVGTNVASDALSNLASAGVNGGALIIVGEDYGQGASVVQERTHATALKSSMPLLDPRCDLPTLVDMTEKAFELSEACHLPVILSLRIRACHMTGSFIAKNNRSPDYGANHHLEKAKFDYARIVQPPSLHIHEKEKFDKRLPLAQAFIREQQLNEIITGRETNLGIILQGGMYATLMRVLNRLGLADAYGNTDIPLLILNVVNPLVPEEIFGFLEGKDGVLIVEEGSPAFIENQVRAMAQERGFGGAIFGKNPLPAAGEYNASVLRQGVTQFLDELVPQGIGRQVRQRNEGIERVIAKGLEQAKPLSMPSRPPGFCTGCPERPVFTALKLLMKELGPIHVCSDIGCSSFATLPPFNMGSTMLGYGLSLASAGAVEPALGQPAVVVMGDGAFWHSGFSTGVINAHWQELNTVLVILDNGYASATGQQHIPSTGSTPWGQSSTLSIEKALRGVGITWIRRIDSYSVKDSANTLREALTTNERGLRVVISDNECMLAQTRRNRTVDKASRQQGHPVIKERFGVDAEVCTGDHSCMRMSGCPSLTLKPAEDPLKDGPTAYVNEDCVACGLCGESAHAAQLCPSFYRAQTTFNAKGWKKMMSRLNGWLLGLWGAS